MSNSTTSSAMYQRIRQNDPKFLCVRFVPSCMSITTLSQALLSNSTINQLIVGGGVPVGHAGDHRIGSSASQAVRLSIAEFAVLLEACHHLPLVTVDVSEMELAAGHIDHLVHLLSACKTLRRIVLSNNAISPADIKKLGEAMSAHPNIQALDLAACRLGDEGLVTFLEAFSPESCRFTTLNLSTNRLTMAAAQKLAGFVLENCTLIRINLNGNFIPHEFVETGITPLLNRNAASGQSSKLGKQRPSSALGFLSSVDPRAAPCPSLDLLTQQVEASS